MNHLLRALDNQNQWWKYLVVFLVGFIGANIIGGIPLVIVIVYQTMKNGAAITPSDNFADFSVYGISPNTGLILMMIPFVVGLFSVILLLKPLHKRSYKEVINGTNKIRWSRFFFAALIWALIAGIFLVVDYFINSENYTVNFNLSALIPLVIISLCLIPLQTTFEEILFRGYLAQGVAAWTRNKWMVLILPSLFFALVHSFNPEVSEYGFFTVMPQYVLFGLVFGLATILDDGIEVAMGAHAANNIFASIFITSKASALQTPALLKIQEVNPSQEVWGLLLSAIVFILILAVKYKWNFSILNKKVQPDTI